MIAVYAAGPQAIVQRDRASLGILREILANHEDSPDVEQVTLEAIVGAIYRALHDQIRAEGTETLPEVAPLATYLALAPLLGAEQACEVAQRRRAPALASSYPRALQLRVSVELSFFPPTNA